MRREEPHQAARVAGDLERLDGGLAGGRVDDAVGALERLERADHPVAAGELRAAGVGAELAEPREPGDDDGAEDREGDVEHERRDEVDEVGDAPSLLVAAEELGDEEGEDAGEEHREGVHDALDERHRHHVAVGDVGDLVAEDPLHLVAAQAPEEAGGDGDERTVLRRAGGEGVHLVGVVDPDLRHRPEARRLREPVDRGDELLSGRVGRARVDELDAHAPLRHHAGEAERDERAAEAPDEAEDGERRRGRALEPSGRDGRRGALRTIEIVATTRTLTATKRKTRFAIFMTDSLPFDRVSGAAAEPGGPRGGHGRNQNAERGGRYSAAGRRPAVTWATRGRSRGRSPRGDPSSRSPGRRPSPPA